MIHFILCINHCVKSESEDGGACDGVVPAYVAAASMICGGMLALSLLYEQGAFVDLIWMACIHREMGYKFIKIESWIWMCFFFFRSLALYFWL